MDHPGKPHDVQVFFEITGQVVVDNDTSEVAWGRVEFPGAESMRIFNPTGVPLREYSPFDPFTEKGGQPTEHLDWGAAYLTLPNVSRSSGTKKAPKLKFLGKFCRQKSLLKFWPMGGQKKV